MSWFEIGMLVEGFLIFMAISNLNEKLDTFVEVYIGRKELKRRDYELG